MSFWQKQDGSAVENTTTFEAGGGEIQPIPNNTALIGAIEEAKWADWEGESYINLKWRVMRPAEYANRVIFQKLKVFSEKQGDKAKQMLRAIDANCGGKLSRYERFARRPRLDDRASWQTRRHQGSGLGNQRKNR